MCALSTHEAMIQPSWPRVLSPRYTKRTCPVGPLGVIGHGTFLMWTPSCSKFNYDPHNRIIRGKEKETDRKRERDRQIEK